MLKIGVLASGRLGFETLKELAKNYPVEFVLTDKGSDGIISWCSSENKPVYAGNPRNGSACEFIKSKPVDLILSINYLFLIEKDLIDHPKLFALNIHGSLLPKYRGRTPHVWAIINDENETGITLHKIAEGCDTGEVAIQKKVEITNTDTGATILKKFEALYPAIISEALSGIENNSLNFVAQDETKATYFGKRTPDDGGINWNWTSRQIYNWVRAQSDPYPGAFTFFNDNKLTIDWVEESNEPFDPNVSNGALLTKNPVTVKCQDGLIIITSYREDIDLPEGTVFKSIEHE